MVIYTYTGNEMGEPENENQIIKHGKEVFMKATDLLATPGGKFNWLGLIIEIVKAAIAFVTVNAVVN